MFHWKTRSWLFRQGCSWSYTTCRASKKEGVSVDQYWGMCKVVLDSLSIYIYMIYHQHMEVDMQATTRERHKKRQQRTQKSGEKEETNGKCVRKQRAAKKMRRIGEDEILYGYTVYTYVVHIYIYIYRETGSSRLSIHIYILLCTEYNRKETQRRDILSSTVKNTHAAISI